MANTRRPVEKDAPPDLNSTATKQIGIRVPARLSDRLEAIARRESNNVSSVVRRLLTSALNDDDEAA